MTSTEKNGFISLTHYHRSEKGLKHTDGNTVNFEWS